MTLRFSEYLIERIEHPEFGYSTHPIKKTNRPRPFFHQPRRHPPCIVSSHDMHRSHPYGV